MLNQEKPPTLFLRFTPLDLPLQTCSSGYGGHVGYNDPGEQPLGSSQPRVPTSAARTRHVIFKNKLTWNKVGAVLKKSLVPAELFGEVE